MGYELILHAWFRFPEISRNKENTLGFVPGVDWDSKTFLLLGTALKLFCKSFLEFTVFMV